MTCNLSDTSLSSVALADLNSEFAKPTRIIELTGLQWRHNRVFHPYGLAPTLLCKPGPFVLVTAKSTATPSVFTKDTSPHTKTTETSPPSMPKPCQTLTSYVEAFLAKPFPLPADVKASTIQGGRSSLTSPELSKKNNHTIYCLRTLKGFSLTTRALQPLLRSQSLMNWGMTANGKCLTAKISAFPKTGNGCSLSDILEEQPDQKYFLSGARQESKLAIIAQNHSKVLKRHASAD